MARKRDGRAGSLVLIRACRRSTEAGTRLNRAELLDMPRDMIFGCVDADSNEGEGKLGSFMLQTLSALRSLASERLLYVALLAQEALHLEKMAGHSTAALQLP